MKSSGQIPTRISVWITGPKTMSTESSLIPWGERWKTSSGCKFWPSLNTASKTAKIGRLNKQTNKLCRILRVARCCWTRIEVTNINIATRPRGAETTPFTPSISAPNPVPEVTWRCLFPGWGTRPTCEYAPVKTSTSLVCWSQKGTCLSNRCKPMWSSTVRNS